MERKVLMIVDNEYTNDPIFNWKKYNWEVEEQKLLEIYVSLNIKNQ